MAIAFRTSRVHPYTVARRIARGWPVELAENFPAYRDLTGQRFGRLVVVEEAGVVKHPNGAKHKRWRCRCDCGTVCLVTGNNLKYGRSTKSCGCLKRELIGDRSRKHGHTSGGKGTREFNAWRAMLDRCRRPKCKEFKWYGARGISVCEQWKLFPNFLADMGPCPDGMTLDRIDNDWHYLPANCRWISQRENCNNKRNNVWTEVDGQRMTASQAAALLGLPTYTMYRRLRAGDTIDQIRDRARHYGQSAFGH
jgi:hypothetical protein